MSSTTLSRPPDLTVTSDATRRTKVQRVALALSMTIALLYGLIAPHVVTVIDGPAEQVARDQLGFALPAAAVCLLAPVSWQFDRRLLWIAGAVLQVPHHRHALCSRPAAGPGLSDVGHHHPDPAVRPLAGLTPLSIRSARPPQHE